MKNERGKLLKVTFEYENDTYVLEEKAQKWLDYICVLLAITKNMNPSCIDKFKFNWKKL